MADYTMEIRELVNLGYHFNLDRYPIFDENYRRQLNEKILAHYWYREIGQETPDRFNHYLGTRMGEIMPYYNQLYMSELIKFDPLATDYMESSSAEERVHEAIENMFGNTINNITSATAQTDRTQNDETSSSTENSTSNDSGNYSKNGNRTGTNEETRTENLKEDITAKSTTTNDLKTETDSETENTGTSKTTGNKTTNFSDIPQAGVTTTVTQAPDGTITTETTGYLTTQTQENSTETGNTSNTTTSHSETTNTGTVVVEGTSNRTNDNTINTNGEDREIWDESGNNTGSNISTGKQETSRNALTNTDSQRNENRNFEEAQKRVNKNDEKTGTKGTEFRKGRAGFSPSALIREYRETLLNIDRLIIDELGDLFMEVY